MDAFAVLLPRPNRCMRSNKPARELRSSMFEGDELCKRCFPAFLFFYHFDLLEAPVWDLGNLDE